MGKFTAEMSMSLDGFIIGPDDGIERSLGNGRIELESTRVIESPGVTHLRYRIVQ